MSDHKMKLNTQSEATTSNPNHSCYYTPYIGDPMPGYPGDSHWPYWNGGVCQCGTCSLNGTQYCTKCQIATTVLGSSLNLSQDLPPANVQSFEAIATALPLLYERKNTAYGDSFTKSVSKYGKVSALTRMSDKWNRLENLMLNDVDENDESVTDTLLDLASYCIMTVSALHNHEVDDVVKTLIGEGE